MAEGEPASYLTLTSGTDVVSGDGERVGTVEHVLHDEQTNITDGLVIDVRLGPGGLRFVDASEVAEIRADRVILALDKAQVEKLPEPGPNPAVMTHGGAEDAEGELQQKLRRAWDRISGR